MEASLALKSLSSQAVSKSNGLKTKTKESPGAFGVVLQNTVTKGKEAPPLTSSEQKQGNSVQTLKQQLLQAVGVLNQEKSPLTADQTQLKGLLEQLLKNLDGKNGESGATVKPLTPLLKNLDEALEKQQKTTTGSQDSQWSQLLSTVQALMLQGQSPAQNDLNHSMEGKAAENNLITDVSSKASQTTSLPLMTVSAGLKGTNALTNKKLEPFLLPNKEPNQSANALSFKDEKSVDSANSLKTPKVTKVTSLSQLMSDKPKSDDSNGKQGTDLSAMLVGGRPMNKVQQFLFHQTNAAQPELSPADQIANQIKALMSQTALKSSDGQLSINLNLHPDNLGAVQLAITQTDGGLTASITAHSSLTKDLIDSQLNHLQQSLQESGIAVYKLDVNLAQTPSGQSDPTYQPPQDQGQGRNQGQQQSRPEEQVIEGPEFETWLKEGLDT